MYYVIKDSEDGRSIGEYTQDQLEKYLENFYEDFGVNEISIRSSLTKDYMEENEICVIKGEINRPKPLSIVRVWEVN